MDGNWNSYRESAEQAAALGDWESAEAHWLDAYREAETFHKEDPRFFHTLDQLAEVLIKREKMQLAETLLKRSVEMREHCIKPDLGGLAGALNRLSAFYCANGQYDQAEPVLVSAVKICRDMCGAESAQVATAVEGLAMNYHAQGKVSLAEQCYQNAMRIRTDVLGAGHPETYAVIENYANLLDYANRSGEATQLRQFADDQASADRKTKKTSEKSFALPPGSFKDFAIPSIVPGLNRKKPDAKSEPAGNEVAEPKKAKIPDPPKTPFQKIVRVRKRTRGT